jgi:hypothetical protein
MPRGHLPADRPYSWPKGQRLSSSELSNFRGRVKAYHFISWPWSSPRGSLQARGVHSIHLTHLPKAATVSYGASYPSSLKSGNTCYCARLCLRNSTAAAWNKPAATHAEDLPSLDSSHGYYVYGRPNQRRAGVQTRETGKRTVRELPALRGVFSHFQSTQRTGTDRPPGSRTAGSGGQVIRKLTNAQQRK